MSYKVLLDSFIKAGFEKHIYEKFHTINGNEAYLESANNRIHHPHFLAHTYKHIATDNSWLFDVTCAKITKMITKTNTCVLNRTNKIMII